MTPLGFVVIIKRTGIEGFRYPLQQATCLLGRGAECDIRIQLPVVSKQQCKIEFDQQLKEAVLINLNSVNPTLLNGVTFVRPTKLVHGDIITIVDRSFRFEYGNGFPIEKKPVKPSEPKSKEVTPTQSRSSSISTVISDQYQRRTVQVFKNIHAKYTEENISRQFSLLQSLEAKIIANKSKNYDASDNTGDHLPGKAPTLESSSEDNASQFSTPEHPGKSKKNTNSPFKQLFGLMREELNSKCQQIGDHLNRKSEPSIQVSMSGREWETELLHLPRSKPIRRSEVVGLSQSWHEPQKKGQEAVAALPKEGVSDTSKSPSAKGAEAHAQEHKSPRSKRRKSESLLSPVKTSGKRKSKAGSGKDKQKSVSGTRVGSPSVEAQSPQTLYTLRSQTKKPEASPLGNDKKEAVTAAKATPAEKLVLKQSDPNGGGETMNLVQKKGSPKGNKSADTQLNPKRASSSDQILKKIQDELYFEGVSETRASRVSLPFVPLTYYSTYFKKRNDIEKMSELQNYLNVFVHMYKKKPSFFLPKLEVPKEAKNDNIFLSTYNKSGGGGGGEAAQIASVSPDISQFDISDFEDSTSEINNVSEGEESSAKRRRVSFGVHLRPELFDENLPPNTPLKRGETPGLRRTSLGRAVLKKSIIKLTSEKEASSSAAHVEQKAALGQSSTLSPKASATAAAPAPAPREASSPACLPSKAPPPAPVVGDPARKTNRRSSSGRRSQHDALQTIFAKRRSGASEANLMVVQSWADVVKLGTKKSQGEVVVKHGLERRKIKKQKRCLTPKKPANQAQNHFSTGHANSPCTIVIGRAHTEKVIIPAQPYRVLNNLILNSKMDMNEDLTGLDEMFRTPMTEKQKTANVCPESPTPQFLCGEKAKACTSSDEALINTSDKLAERVISSTQDKAKQTSGPIIPCRRSPRNRQSLGDDKIIKTQKEISDTRGDEIMETAVPEVDKDHKKLTPSSKRLKITPKETGPTPYLNRNSESAAQGEGALVENHPKTLAANPRVSKLEDRFPGTPNKEENSVNNLRNQKPKTLPQVGIAASFKIKEPLVTDIQKHSRTSLQKEEYSSSDAQGTVAITRQQHELSSMKKLERTPKEKTEPTEDLTGIRELMTTPTPTEDRIVDKKLRTISKQVEDSALDIKVQKNLQTPPKQVVCSVTDATGQKKPMAIKQQMEAEDFGSIKEFIKTPKRKCEPVEPLTAVKRLMRTPKDKVEQLREDRVNYEKLMKTPKEKEPVESQKNNQNVNVRQTPKASRDPGGLRRCVDTPKEKIDPSGDLTTPKQVIEPVKDQVSKTTMMKPEQNVESVENLTETKVLIKTPKEKEEPAEDKKGSAKKLTTRSCKEKREEVVEDSVGIKKLKKTPNASEPVEDMADLGKLNNKTSKEKKRVGENLTALKKLMRIRKGKIKLEDLTSLKSLMQTPKEKGEPDEDLTGIKSLMQTPKEKREPDEDLTGIKSLMQTPKEKGESVEDLTGIKRLMQTPKEKGEPVEDLTGIKRLMRTPKEKGEPVEDLTGIKRLMQTPKEKGEPVEDLTGIKRLMRTPKEKGGSVEDLTGIKRLMRTPKEKGEPVEDLTGIKRLMQTPKEKGEPVEDLTGIKRLMQTPKEKGEPVEDLTGIKRLMRTPKEKGEPVEDLTGIKRLMRTPKEKGELVEDLTGIKRLMRTPKEKGESVEDLTGIKRLMRAPKEKGGSVEDLTGIKRLMRTPKQKGGSVEDLTGIKRLMQTPKEKGEIEKNLTNVPAFMETSKNNISSTHTIRQNNPKEVTDRDSVVSEILHEIEILRRPAIKGVSASNQENQTIEKTPELLREVPAQDKSVDRCQRQICFNPSEGGEYHNDLSNVANDIFREREEEKVKDVIENQRTITLRSRSKIKSDKEPEGSVRLFHSTRVRIKNTEKIVKTPWEENMKERVEQSSNLSQSSKIKPSEEEKKETLEGLHGKFGDMSGNKERMAPFQLRKNQARREVTSSTSSVISDVENSEKRGIMGALRSRNRNKVDTEWQEPSSPVSDDISHTVRDEKPMKVVLKEKKLKTQIMASGISLRSRKKEDKEMLSFDHLTPDSDIAYTDEEKESVKSLPEKLKGQRVVLLDSRNRNNNVREINEHDSLSSESPTGNDEKSAIVNEDKVALRTRSRNKNKVYEEKQESITTDTSCIENKGGKANGLQVQWNTTFLRTQNRIKATKESQEPDSLPNEAGKPHTEDYEKTSGKGKFAAFQEKSKSVGPSKGITRNRSKMDKESEGSIASSRDTEMNKPVKSFQENSINETIMSLRSQSKKKDTEPPLSYMTKIMSIPNNEKMPGKSLPEKKLKESPLSQDKVSLRPRTVKFEKLYPKDEKNLGKDHNLSDTTGSGGMSLRSRNKNKMETGLRGSNPVTTSEKDAQKSINTSSRMLKNSVIPHETVGRSRNKIGPQESCRLPSATEVVLVEEDKKTLSQKNLEKKLSLQVGRLDPLKTGNRNKAGQELHSLHNVTAMTATEENKEKMEKILKDQTVAKDLVSRRPRLTIKNNKEVKESMGKDEKENVAQIFPKRGIDRVSLRTSLRNKSDTDLQKSSNLNKKDPSTDAKTTTGKAQNGKHINIAFLENKKGNSRISSNIKEPTNSIQEGHFVKLSQVPDKTFKVILTSAKDTQSEPTLLRERSTLLKSTSQTQKGNDTNSQERTLRFRRKCTVKETEVLTASSKQSHINPKLTKNIKA